MMKKIYIKPVIVVSVFESEDIITASSTNAKGFADGVFNFSTESGVNSIKL